ncbi:MAG TPA: hypothetical protein VN017_05400 [Pseudoxanthomonas sp.]|nr:hypothetical protein [Pseudoxanthomonas sp.]
MFERIDIYVKRNGRWRYFDCTRACRTLTAARQRFESIFRQPVRARWSERCAP